ncbi:uncharacterized protein [Panulirus ornatus]|uniref:uncharacterized protein n=1 Tax=Panulirus ornatus TaxID=150431 RepID=UPI003A8B9CE6
MEIIDPVKTVMPPPPPPAGTVPGRSAEFCMQSPQHYPGESLMKKQRVSGEDDASSTPSNRSSVTASRNLEESVVHDDPVTLWQECINQVQKELETSGREWLRQWSQLHKEEMAAMARIRELYKSAQDMNTGFHHQLDSLHNTVVDVVSSFKK